MREQGIPGRARHTLAQSVIPPATTVSSLILTSVCLAAFWLSRADIPCQSC